MPLIGPLSVFLTSLSAIPLAYLMNQISMMRDPLAMFIVGAAVLMTVTAIPCYVVWSSPQRVDNFFYVLSVFTFAAVTDLIIALENDGIIANFMTFYLREGEPYLKTAHGTMISYWDGVAHYAMYLMILAAQSWNQSYRDVGLYWAASIGHSMLVLMPGIFMGSHGVRWPCLLNIPYTVIPFYYGVQFLFQGRPAEDFKEAKKESNSPAPSIWRRPVDLFFIVFFFAACMLAILRFTAALGGNVQIAKQYMASLEPYLEDSSYPKVQMMVYLFYFLPYYAASIYGLLRPGHSWMLDWSLVHAGAAAQGQFSYIGASFHYRTPYVHRVPQNTRTRLFFWLINGGLMIIPQLFAYRCLNFPSFFARPETSLNHTDEKGSKESLASLKKRS